MWGHDVHDDLNGRLHSVCVGDVYYEAVVEKLDINCASKLCKKQGCLFSKLKSKNKIIITRVNSACFIVAKPAKLKLSDIANNRK